MVRRGKPADQEAVRVALLEEWQTSDEIADALGISRMSAAGHLNQLTRQGFAEAERKVTRWRLAPEQGSVPLMTATEDAP